MGVLEAAQFPEGLWPLLTEARVALADLNGVGRYLPNPDLLLRPLQNREAQKSSSLEGTYTEPFLLSFAILFMSLERFGQVPQRLERQKPGRRRRWATATTWMAPKPSL